ncbi:shikimate kinase [Bacillus methanolicus PB1]|uniref:Shikimate kinase n=1 Tax=Bacillus methanolicus PB1 TaxID=997296 RepID=I3DX73_BACMT|nr:shikimate kinase [Bacillus methanolicus]EIJ78844.1 shikimate kinase [Bacillus methanolicus PB1]
MKSIYLIGFMGSGKTTVGKSFGVKWNWPVIDTDEEIVKKVNKSINQIFEENGEDYFRHLETEILKQLPVNRSIITTGGGIVLKDENRRWMKENGIVVFLYAEPEEIFKRIENDDSRPLLKTNKKAAIEELLRSRLPLYIEAADFTIDTTGKDINEIIKKIEEGLTKE